MVIVKTITIQLLEEEGVDRNIYSIIMKRRNAGELTNIVAASPYVGQREGEQKFAGLNRLLLDNI